MLIVKIGGGKSINHQFIVDDLANIQQPFIVVHGANALRDELAGNLGITKQVVESVSGYSSVLTDERMIDAILMAYAGLSNKRLVERFQQQGINAIGLSGIDGRLVQGKRNKGIRVIEQGKKMLKRDLSGKPQQVNLPLLQLLLENGYVPILSIPICDEQGYAINSENDDIVAQLQQALQADTVIQLIEASGFMEDVARPDSMIARLSFAELLDKEQQAQGRIKRKLHALNKLAKNNVKRVIICDGRVEAPVSSALAGGGTWIE